MSRETVNLKTESPTKRAVRPRETEFTPSEPQFSQVSIGLFGGLTAHTESSPMQILSAPPFILAIAEADRCM